MRRLGVGDHAAKNQCDVCGRVNLAARLLHPLASTSKYVMHTRPYIDAGSRPVGSQQAYDLWRFSGWVRNAARVAADQERR